MLNRVMIIGRLGQDPQLKYSQAGMPIATFSVATDETFTDRDGIRQQRTEWFRVVVFQKVAENCSRFLRKGSLVYVEGSLQTRKWQDQQGMDHSLVEIRAQRVDFLEKRASQDEYRKPYGQEGESYGFEGENRQNQGFQRQQAGGYQQTGFEERPPVFPQDAMGEGSTQPSEQANYGQNEADKTKQDASQLDQVPF